MTRILQENLCQRTYLNGSVFEKHTQYRILIQLSRDSTFGKWHDIFIALCKSIRTSYTNNNLSFLQLTRVISYVYVWIWSHGTITCDLLLNSVLVEPNPCHLTSVSTLHQPLIQWFVFVVQIKITMSETSSYLLCSICTSIQILIHCNILSKTTKMQHKCLVSISICLQSYNAVQQFTYQWLSKILLIYKCQNSQMCSKWLCISCLCFFLS